MKTLQQGLIDKYNQKNFLLEHFPNNRLGVGDRHLLNLIIRKQKIVGFEAVGNVVREMENFGYKTQKPYKPN